MSGWTSGLLGVPAADVIASLVPELDVTIGQLASLR
jgi:hypothetical protein